MRRSAGKNEAMRCRQQGAGANELVALCAKCALRKAECVAHMRVRKQESHAQDAHSKANGTYMR
jgi:hypothetical protein